MTSSRSFFLLFLLLSACGGTAEVDGGSMDAVVADTGGNTDAGHDAGAADSGPGGAGPLDAGTADAGSTDAGALDAGTTDAGGLADVCTSTGGTVSSSSCCLSAGDFPSSCAIGACGCAPDYSHTVQTCSCTSGHCFDPTMGCH